MDAEKRTLVPARIGSIEVARFLELLGDNLNLALNMALKETLKEFVSLEDRESTQTPKPEGGSTTVCTCKQEEPKHQRWDKKSYNSYMREYMRLYRARSK